MWSRLKDLARAAKHELDVYRCVLKHPATPRLAKVLLGVAVGYALLPFELIPDFIPVIGYLDDVIIVGLLVWIALRFVPARVVAECRAGVEKS